MSEEKDKCSSGDDIKTTGVGVVDAIVIILTVIGKIFGGE